MPRKQTAATAHLELYKLLIEKQRLEQELETLEQRQQQITERLTALASETGELELMTQTVQTVQTGQSGAGLIKGSRMRPIQSASQSKSQATSQFETICLEY
ncbi:MAG: hypothetical protein KME07_14615 [Pegethrix bostrychoides GSE-TBD4-15B]|uniref:Uncharacterized protein n=1 Tax=Pegethrix bostrychoides GSE-TBD4-15B TaxID=2839662 RepID=A0A951PCV3_9CYAN|nr:hypothetical protein [Pegethrix bostrychoides GSE-TBD4-15B]